MENIFAFQAIQKLVPNADCIIGETYESINWTNESRDKPTIAEFNTALASVKAEWTANQYQRDREYPALAEQLDLLYHDMTAGKGTKTGEWYKAIKKVKTDNPKPE